MVLDLSNLLLTGPLPGSWGAPPAFPALRFLALHGNTLGDAATPGPLPASWTQPASLSSLQASACACLQCLHRPSLAADGMVPPPALPEPTLTCHCCCSSACRCDASCCPQSLVLFPGNHAVCTPGLPGNYTSVAGTAGGGGGGSSSGYRVLDVFSTALTTAYMACYS